MSRSDPLQPVKINFCLPTSIPLSYVKLIFDQPFLKENYSKLTIYRWSVHKWAQRISSLTPLYPITTPGDGSPAQRTQMRKNLMGKHRLAQGARRLTPSTPTPNLWWTPLTPPPTKTHWGRTIVLEKTQAKLHYPFWTPGNHNVPRS